ncbi:beach-domain-containing protein [Thozetella sp. PMI_491]|nr:beach-domain-containing protein [Thozetella sp. PMI_491]
MSSQPRRYCSSTSASTPPPTSKATEVLQSLLDRIPCLLQARSSYGYPDLRAIIEHSLQIHRCLAASQPPCPPQDDFRHLRGFQNVLNVLRSFAGFYDSQKRSVAEKEGLFELLHAILAIISTAFQEHQRNRRYFKYEVEGGGWEVLEQVTANIGLGGTGSDAWTNCQLFGQLLAFALDDQRLNELCQTAASTIIAPLGTSCKPEQGSNTNHDDPQLDGAGNGKAIETRLREIIGPKAVLRHAEIIHTVVGFWEPMPRNQVAETNLVSIIVLEALCLISSASFYNLSALHGTGILSRFLRLLFGTESRISSQEHGKIMLLCKALMALGIKSLADAQFLLSTRDPATSEFCLSMAQKHTGPPFLQLDLSLHGHSSIELPSLGRPFPPQSSPGYTFTAWFRVDNFDPASHTTIFGLFDSTQTCFLLAYLEKDTRNFILQTSITSQRPSVRFRSATFKEGQWYHIGLVHRRPTTITASKASLYVNGEFVEQIRASYPVPPPLSNGSTERFGSFTTSSNKTSPVQVFIGTPRDLSTQIGSGLVFSRWSLASAHLFEDILSDDFLAVHYWLGPRYQGNFQDCLGRFQTYRASAALGLRNRVINVAKEDNSHIIRAIRDKASKIFSEQKVLMSTLPTSVFRSDASFLDSALLRSLSRASANNLLQLTTKSGSAIAINCAIPCINDALIIASGVSVLAGDPILALPYYFDDSLWQLGGFTAVALKLAERASTGDELLRSVELMFLCINRSWRNSEAMEMDNGYAILSMLLRAKLGYGVSSSESSSWRLPLTNEGRDMLSCQLLSLVLDFVGYRHANPLESLIINPLAYSILLIDLDIWRKSALITQELYYKQFVTFAAKSKHHQFNSRRLLKMGIIKRLLSVMKAETITEDVLPYFMDSFESLIKCDYDAKVHRSLTLFITYAFHTTSSSLPRTPKPLSGPNQSGTPSILRGLTIETNSSAATTDPKILTRKQLGIRLLELYTKLLCEKGNLANIRNFARSVTIKWPLCLLSEDDPEVVVYSCRILARLLVTQTSGYAANFCSKNGGFWIMSHRLKHWWDIPALWPILFSVLFGYDVAEIDFDKSFDIFSLSEILGSCRVVYPDVLPVITSMLQRGIRDTWKCQDDPDSPADDRESAESPSAAAVGIETRPRTRSMPLSEETELRKIPLPDNDRVNSHAIVLQNVIRFLADMHGRSADFRDFALSSDYVRLLLSALYPVIVSTDPVTAETELNFKNPVLTFGGDVIIRSVPGTSGGAPIVRTTPASSTEPPLPSPSLPQRGTPLCRPSSFVRGTTQVSSQAPSPARLTHVMSPKKLATQLLELVLNLFGDQILARKEFPGFGLFLKVPPGFQEHQVYFESYILKNTISNLESAIQLNQRMLCEPNVLANIARFNHDMVEAIYERRFISGAEPMLDFTGMLLNYLQRPEISSMKSVRLCSSWVLTIHMSFLKLTLLRLSDIDDAQTTDVEATTTMQRILYWQAVLIGCLGAYDDYKLIWYQLYIKLINARTQIRLAAARIWRILLVQKPEESAAIFRQCLPSDQQQLAKGFRKLTEVDDLTFVEWVDQQRSSLDVFFFGAMSKTWEEFVSAENERTVGTVESKLWNRKERLKEWHQEGLDRDNIILRHEMANGAWMKQIYSAEHCKHQRLIQDQQDDMAYIASVFAKMDSNLRRPGAVFGEASSIKWRLDRTEGRNRMRLRLLPDHSDDQHDYQPRQRATDTLAPNSSPKLNTAVGQGLSSQSISNTPTSSVTPLEVAMSPKKDENGLAEPEDGLDNSEQSMAPEDDFELVDDPNDLEPDDAFEDKSRKVMRCLDHGDSVESVYNISRIIGLEACEAVLIIGKDALYIMDNVFRRADGELVNVWQAPPDERDPYSQIITGTKSGENRQTMNRSEQECRSWRWDDLINISKRRSLFRDVAIEVFFADGSSYLLTTITPTIRDEIFMRLIKKAPHTVGHSALPNPEDAWRLEAIKVSDDAPQTFGSKFGSMFNASSWNPFIRQWQKGEISNFHYLMLVNTMAGRTFNDLTQYPIFPWVLQDYTSEELNLDAPATFRDLTKPMGAQTVGRQADFMMHYKSLEEIGETPFHYGTHYSSAMIVSSYLMRLPPFMQSFILLQGGSFGPPDRLFFSVARAWNSASKDNATDVRELIPEFYCLPEFLTNANGYNFVVQQGNSGRFDNVILPPWAKGDPKVFIAKHRAALESPYVSRNLHHWIDLVFGFKQRGEAAIKSLNVFHHLSYHGAKDLDNIADPKEKAITTGTIRNFGQTPHQVFSKPHLAREHVHCHIKRLDMSVHALTRLPYPLLESHERVASLIYTPKLNRLLCASPFRLNLPPHYDKFLEWGYADNSVRFYHSDNGKPAGLLENPHIGQISCLAFADAKTLITAGEDCVVSVFAVQTISGKPAELLLRSSLFGHKTPVTTIAVSKALSTILTVSQDGIAFLWDLSRLDFVRKLPFARSVDCVSINNISGEIMLCSGPNVILFTLNGDLILDQNVCGAEAPDDYVVSCAFYEGAGNEWLENFLVFTGHRRGKVKVWRKTVDTNGTWILEFIRRLDHHADAKSKTGANMGAAITCITPMPQLVFTGDEDGRVYEWNLIQQER